ncbi:V-type ATPase 116kDa subunit family protein [uncultured Thiodictyon sp.]|uniref:V-type ATP synthase subunit I n=1 Tax=uncultured Thiodictyon sp. TaxID=1846217 RepID=UPI0025F243CC|nr:V-type ATPase 116kDa subunit family protein [uncultured Thiodictyon sp.]
MLRPRLMKHVRLLVLTEDLPQASLALAQTENFHPDPRTPAAAALVGLPARDYCETYHQAHARLDKIAKLIPLEEYPALAQVRVVPHQELTDLNGWLGEAWQEASSYEEQLRRLDDQERLIREQAAALVNFQHLDIDLKMLRNKTRFLDFYVGIVPRENLLRLEGAVGLAAHLLHVYMQRGEQSHVVIVGPTGERETQLTAVLAAAGFQPLAIPAELDEQPEQLSQTLETRQAQVRTDRESLHERLTQWFDPLRGRLLEARRTLLLAEPLVTLDPSIRSSGHLAHLAGWVPAHALPALSERLTGTLTRPFELQARDPLPAERALVPTVPVKNWLLTPFALLVKQYGIPEYGEVDPTPWFAVTYLAMFGAMFGDVGQGAVIAGLAWAFRTRLGDLWRFGLLAGLSSVAFGLVYGSVFGYDHALPALWMSPIHDPILMLELALGYGVIFLTIACLLAIYNRLAIGNRWGAVFGHHGMVNLLFYLALVWGGLNLARGTAFGTAPLLLVVGALAALAWFSWQHLAAPLGEKILVVFIETLETVIGYVSNTLSFLRVAAFSINHVALSIAVFTLAGMMGDFGHLITVILGNVFVLVLEGGIVMIQVMRLQYYEGFSRYFAGEGHEFTPLRLRRGPVAP